MFNQYNELSNYMTYDSSSLNQYNYKNLDDVFPVYQQYHLSRLELQSKIRLKLFNLQLVLAGIILHWRQKHLQISTKPNVFQQNRPHKHQCKNDWYLTLKSILFYLQQNGVLLLCPLYLLYTLHPKPDSLFL